MRYEQLLNNLTASNKTCVQNYQPDDVFSGVGQDGKCAAFRRFS